LRPVGAGKIAQQKLTFRMMGAAFNDGTRTNAADLLFAYMFAYRWGARGDGENSSDPLIAAASSVMRERLVGIRVVGTDAGSKSFRIGDFEVVRELIVVETYISAPPIDPEQEAAIAPPWSTLPWHLLALMEEAVVRGMAAFSQEEASRRGVPWLDLVRSQAVNNELAALVETFEREGFRPAHLEPLVSAEDARKRWTALRAFYNERGHFLVTNGPYLLKRWSAGSASLEAFRDLSYPLGVGSYDAYAVPRRGYVTGMEQDNDRVTLSADIELLVKHMRSYDIARKPLRAIAPDAIRRAAPECRYMVTDSAGKVVSAGQVALTAGDARFHLALGGKLPAGRFTLHAQIVVNGNAMNAEISRLPLAISSPP
jgi:hypothetical protein